MAITRGTPGSFPIDFGISEKLSSILGRQVGAYNPNQSIGKQGLDYTNSNQNTQTLRNGGSILGLASQSSGSPANYPIAGGYQGPSSGGSSGNNGSSNFVDPYSGSQQSQQSLADAELQSLNTQYDRLRAEAEQQLPFIQNERNRSLSNLANEMTGVQNTITRQKEATQQNRESQIGDAGQIAQQTQRSNRNTLRALGILNSSAAGELLSKPMNEFDKVRSTIIQESTRRFNELDDFLNQKTAEHANLVAQIEDNYSRIVGQIQNDLRFNERERADSIRSVNAALQARLAEIQQSQASWQNEIQAMKANLSNQLGSINSYNQITGDMSGIRAQQANLLQQAQPNQLAVYDDQKKKTGLSGFLNN